MKCPYNHKKEITYLQWQQENNSESGQPESGQQVTKVEFELMDCLKDECAAWRNGCCNYNE